MAPRTRRYSTRLADMQIDSDVYMEQDDEIDVENYDDEQEVEDADVEPEEDEDEDEDEKDEIQSEDEDEEPIPSPRKTQPRLRIKLKLGANKRITSSSDSTARPTPEVETTPSRTRTRKKIRSVLESQDSDSPESDDDDESGSISRATGQPKPMTTRQAVLASVVDSSHVSLGESSRSKKKVLNESELALRREETARKRKNLTEKKLEDEKVETINRLLKKQSRPRNKRGTALDDRSPMPSANLRKGKQKAKEDDGEEGEEVFEEETMPAVEEEVKPTMYRWVSSQTGGEGQEIKMVLSFSVPPNALPTVPSDPGLRPPGPSRCAVTGCQNPRKYRLVKDWTIGACGMDHLKLLEG